MATDEQRREEGLKAVLARQEEERRINEEFGIALGKNFFMACSNWEGKESCEKTIWDALVSARLELRQLRAERQWISVDDERKPPLAEGDELQSVPVLLYVREWEARHGSGVVLGHYLYGSQQFRPNGSHGWEDRVTHWKLPHRPAAPAPPHQEPQP